jgi:hypothetical protein
MLGSMNYKANQYVNVFHLSPGGRRDGALRPDRGRVFIKVQSVVALPGRRLRPRRGEPVRAAPLEPTERAITEATQGRDVVGQEHKPERQHPEAKHRQDGETSADDQKYPSRNARPAGAWLSEPAGYRLHPARQPAEKPPKPPLMIGADDSIGRSHGLRAQAPEIGKRA